MSPKNSLQLKKPPPEHLLCLVFQPSQPKPRSFQDLRVPTDFSVALGDVTWLGTPGIFPVKHGWTGWDKHHELVLSHPQGHSDAFLLPRRRNLLRNSSLHGEIPLKIPSFVGIMAGSRNLCSPSFLLSSGSCSRTLSDGPSGMVTWNCRKAFSCSSSSASKGAVGSKRMELGLGRGQGHPASRGTRSHIHIQVALAAPSCHPATACRESWMGTGMIPVRDAPGSEAEGLPSFLCSNLEAGSGTESPGISPPGGH